MSSKENLMGDGANVSFTSDVPVLEYQNLVRRCLEAATELQRFLKGGVSVRFSDRAFGEKLEVIAEVAWRNEVYFEVRMEAGDCFVQDRHGYLAPRHHTRVSGADELFRFFVRSMRLHGENMKRRLQEQLLVAEKLEKLTP